MNHGAEETMRKTAIALLLAACAAAPAHAAQDPAEGLRHLLHGGLGTKVEGRRAERVRHRVHAGGHAAHHAKRHREAARASSLRDAERAGYKPVSALTDGAFPNFYPGLGSVYVRPKTLPVGPFLAFDHKNRQVSTIYMLSLEKMNSHDKFEATGTRVPRTDHVSVYFHGGHPGVDFPHYHYVNWHVSKKDEALVAK